MPEQQRYKATQMIVNNILSKIDCGEIAIPDIQRPFVWKATKVRNLIDSLYKGFPVGYIIIWKNNNMEKSQCTN